MSGRVGYVELRCGLDRGRDLLGVATGGEMSLAPSLGAASAELAPLGRLLELGRVAMTF
jgi:hypothetical protein